MESLSRFSNALRANRVPELLQKGYEASPDVTVIGGDSAMVAPVTDGAGERYAIRAANEFGTGLFWERHYRSMNDGLPHSVRGYFPRSIRPVPGGITLVGRKMPAVLMEWIDGPTVFEAITRASSRGNRMVLDAIAAALRDLSIGLRDGRVTHGDLTPDNLMLRPDGDLICVDLDTLEWPGARKRIHDVGQHSYRHPGRSGTPAHQDAFAILVMFVSTVLLSESPDLREQLGRTRVSPDSALLFSSWDLQDIAHAESIATVRENASEMGRRLIDLLVEASTSEAFRSQHLLDQAFDLVPLAAAPVPDEPEVEREIPTPALDAIQEQELDIAAAVARLRELYGDSPSLVPKRSGTFDQTWPEPDASHESETPVEPVWEEHGEASVPASTVVARPIERVARWPERSAQNILEDEAREAARIDGEISRLARSRSDDEILRLAAEANRANLILAEGTRRLIRLANERSAVKQRLNRALQQNDRRELADLAVSGDLALLGDTTRESLVKVLQALEWPGLLRALETDDDSLILLWFDEELFEDEKSLPGPMRLRVTLARNRIDWLERVRSALRARDAEALEPLIAHEPQNARARLSESERRRVRELISRHRALHELRRSLRSGNTQRIISALAAVEKSGAVIEDMQTWSAVRRIVERTELLQDVTSAARKSPPDDRRLASLLPRVKELGIAHDPVLRGELAYDRLEQMIVRGAAVRRIRRGIALNDDRAIRLAAFPDTTGALSLLTSEERIRVDEARARKRVRRIDV